MISTVTMSSVSAMADTGLMFVLGVAAVVTLVLILIVKQLASASVFPRFWLLGKYLNVAIAPLVMAFAVIVVTKVAETLP